MPFIPIGSTYIALFTHYFSTICFRIVRISSDHTRRSMVGPGLLFARQRNRMWKRVCNFNVRAGSASGMPAKRRAEAVRMPRAARERRQLLRQCQIIRVLECEIFIDFFKSLADFFNNFCSLFNQQRLVATFFKATGP